ncbi:polyhydroxybutyrate depolymerase [Neorhizobium lilium]|uniref:Polyhydroxybutyrate depolymerase n=1 Tax=Neorhizobium lilium TaxID=2503024 RepID=A0A3S3T054_9HYPH|nr:PHB depolymerase family esterase [Neorhizobium lilium]RWX78886.1 polyhydroxybutyrate depolymerase [Neorhizobium lilium]
MAVRTHDEALMDFALVAGYLSRSALVRSAAAGAVFLGLMASADAASAAGCGEVMQPGRHPISFNVDGVSRSGVYFIPSAYDGSKKMPVVFDLHGSNSNPDGQLNRSSWDKVAEKNGFVVVALQGSLPGKTSGTFAWNVPFVPVSQTIIPTGAQGGMDEMAFIQQAVKTVKQEFCIDPARVYASGYSGGGRMLSAYICSGHDDFSAAGFVHSLRAGRPVEVEGKWLPDPVNCTPGRPVSIMAFAGVKDGQNPYSGGGNAYWQYGFKTAIQRWTQLDGCKGNGDTKTVNGVTFSLYGTCQNGARIATYVFDNGTHDWPKPVPSTQAVLAAAKDGETGMAKVVSVSASKPAFDANVDPASRMWDFFGKTDSSDVVATAAPAKVNAAAKPGTSVASDCATEAENQGTSCISSQPINMRRSGQGVQGAL